jgi:Tfp pilus assembly protein PilE
MTRPRSATAGSVPGRRSEAGFTVSEFILVAVFVVGLIMVAVTSADGIESENRRSNCQTELRNLKMAVAEIHAERGRFPQSLAEVVSAGKAELEDIDAWELIADEGGEEPGYRPVTGSC